MEILKNKWMRFVLIIIMIFLIINSNKNGREAIKYLRNTAQLKKDISYTLSKTREVVAISKMTKDEIAEYYIQKQKEQEEKEKLERKKLIMTVENIKDNSKNAKSSQNLKNISKLSILMKKEEGINVEPKDATIKINQDKKPLSDEEKLFDEVYVEKTYGPLKEIKTRMIECGDYTKLEYMIYEDNKKLFDKKMQLYLLIGSDIIPDMEKIVTGMYLNQNKKIDIATRENYSKSGEYIETKKIVQEIHILNIKEVNNKGLLNCDK